MDTIKITPKRPRTRWVALKLDTSNEIISEGMTPEVVIKKADKLVEEGNYIMQWIPRANISYIL